MATVHGVQFESIAETKRLELNGDKIFRIWEQWGQQLEADTPRYSTPKRHANNGVSGRTLPNIDIQLQVKRAGETKRSTCMLAIRKTFGKIKSKPQSTIEKSPINDGREPVKCIRKSASEGELQTKKPLSSLENCFTVRSEPDLRASGVSWVFSSSSDQQSSLTDDQEQESREHREMERSLSCPEFWKSGRSVDESMTAFLANADKDNLNSFLNFYNKMTQQRICRS